MAKYPGFTVVGTLSLSIFMLSYIMRIAERPAFKQWTGWSNVSIVNNVYMVIITMTTVGYGDFVPITTIGK